MPSAVLPGVVARRAERDTCARPIVSPFDWSSTWPCREPDTFGIVRTPRTSRARTMHECRDCTAYHIVWCCHIGATAAEHARPSGGSRTARGRTTREPRRRRPPDRLFEVHRFAAVTAAECWSLPKSISNGAVVSAYSTYTNSREGAQDAPTVRVALDTSSGPVRGRLRRRWGRASD